VSQSESSVLDYRILDDYNHVLIILEYPFLDSNSAYVEGLLCEDYTKFKPFSFIKLFGRLLGMKQVCDLGPTGGQMMVAFKQDGDAGKCAPANTTDCTSSTYDPSWDLYKVNMGN
jgi:hypothetical protein